MPASLLCLIGLPGSGKTTLADSLKNYYAEIGVKCVCVEYDSFIQDWSQGVWKWQRRKLLDDVSRVAAELSTDDRSVVILDDNFYYRSMRYEVFRIAKKLSLGFGQVFLNTPFKTCCSRNASRPNAVSFEVMSRMKSLMEPPEPLRSPWERSSAIIDNPNLQVVLDLVETTWAQPYSPTPENQNPPQENSSTHFADLALRRIVKTVMVSTHQKQRSNISQKLTAKKKSVLEDVKMNNIILPVVDPDADAVAVYVSILEPYFSDLLHR